MVRILLVDSDRTFCAALGDHLQRDGFDVRTVHDGESAEREVLNGSYSLLAVNIQLPRLNGMLLLRRVRQHSHIPVLMLTESDDEVDLITSLEWGADDYVRKSCSARELSARMRAVLRRTTPQPSTPVSLGALTLWPHRHIVEWSGARLAFTAAEFRLLEVLASRVGHVVSKGELSHRALGRPLGRFDRCIDVHVSSIRQKLPERPGNLPWIQTVRGLGYLLVPE